MSASSNRRSNRSQYGIGEWYGHLFTQLSGVQRKQFAEIQALPKRQRPVMPCPFRSAITIVPCTKEGGVCSLRLYQQDAETGVVTTVSSENGQLCTTCPYRFYEQNTVYRWIGEVILGHTVPLIVGEVGFLEREANATESPDGYGREDVGRIDHVLVHPETAHLSWCAVEMQAVYFSGDSMSKDFRALVDLNDEFLPFPQGRRHPDFRSSGPKRLMPQLQIKVPTLRRWGKKTCVLVDRMFFDALGHMETVRDVSNSDIAWFVVRYDESKSGAHLEPDSVRFTTLEHAVEGLTAGTPVSLTVFESRIHAKLTRSLGR